RIDELTTTLGTRVVAPLPYAANGYKLRVVDGDFERNALAVANALFETGECRFAHPDFLAHRSLRHTPTDPIFPLQWHLNNPGQSSGTPGADIEAEAAWDATAGSTSITVAVAD